MNRTLRWTLSIAATVAVVAAPAAASTPVPPEDAHVVVDRLAGADRYQTAALVSAQFPDGVDTVYLANGEDWAQGADAVAAGAAAGSGTVPPLVADPSGRPAPILLVRAGGIPAATRVALEELAPTTAVILGGPLVVNPSVDEALVAAGIEPIRVFGQDRYGTAAVLATTFEPGFDTVYVASGQPLIPKPPFVPMMPDALTASARAGAEGAPVLLTKSSSLPVVMRQALEALDPPSITIVGGLGTVSAYVESELRQIAPVSRISGSTRFETAAKLFEDYESGAPTTYLASGEWFADALSVSSLAASQGAPVLLANQSRLPGATRDGLVSLDPDTVRFVGGPGVLSDDLMLEVEELLAPTP
ncbi:cell wall-binding repeat-containing protein [Ornithinimicrobium ciconiae]|uniref:cell wall-binding repeat-containing protein n=1 Tax=Ornithinimicrobium ciconiae TaxID=2594265 RepID=UPI0013FD070F|nr:cell wall-binding repeat-containing protein [Ornithinimicrobium ciconiae]